MARTTGNLARLGKHFSDEDAARELLESLRWPNGATCPHCGADHPYKLTPKPGSSTRKGVWKCRSCRKQFTVTVGTIFEHSHIPISKWLLAIHLLSASKKGISAHQLHRMLGVTYRAAWFMAHRLRHAMKDDVMKLDGIVEVDETYVGGPRKRKPGRPAPGDREKTPVIALVERGESGRVRAFALARVTGDNVQDVIRREVSLNAHMMSDDLNVYHPLSMGFRKHDTIVHSRGEYVRGNVHTNTVEGFFGLLKRGLTGSFHHVSKGHLSRYIDEFCFRYNARKMNDGDRAALIVTGAEGKRLTYQQPKPSPDASANA
jgi:transposase-like protein